MNNPMRKKYHQLYLEMARCAAAQSAAKRRQVGCVIVTKSGMIAPGWNGTLAGFDNDCESSDGKTLPIVVHAERNALDKLTRQGVSAEGAILFVTTAPCVDCAKSIINVGIKEVYFVEQYSSDNGLELLSEAGVVVRGVKYGD